ncbi:CHAT domain-containing protein [uncultured Spirosoma sp.]|uniref:CHAT domain-containing protein n=1 Tax=uncultured Spirosoma sp. TaxID=278208 RepID=UPI00258E5E61|nr:CHAT domain-containing protein [uncultured Spirosoma sp.]
MTLWYRTLLLMLWLSSFARTDSFAQSVDVTPEERRRGIELVQDAQEAYRSHNLARAVKLAEEATPLLELNQQAYAWCMVLRMHMAGVAIPIGEGAHRKAPQSVEQAGQQFLSDATPARAKTLLYSYLWWSNYAERKGNTLFSLGWLSTAFCLANCYEPVWQPVVQYKLFSGIEGLANQILPKKEAGLSIEEKTSQQHEREAVYALFGQIGISTGRAMLAQAVTDRNPANWEMAYQKAIAIYGQDSAEAAILLKASSNLYQTYGDTETAIKKMQLALSILQRQTNPDDQKLLACYMDMALLRLQAKQYQAVAETISQAYPLLIRQNRLNMGMGISGRRKELYAIANNDMRALVAYAACVNSYKTEPALLAIAYNVLLHLDGLLLDDSRQMRATLHDKLAQASSPTLQQCYADWLAKRSAFLNGTTPEREKLGEAVARAETRLLDVLRSDLGTVPSRTTLTWQQVQARLRPTEAAVSFVRFGAVSGRDYKRFPAALPSTDTTIRPVEWLYGAMVVRPGYTHPRFALLGSEAELSALFDKTKTPTNLYRHQRGPGFKNSADGDSLYRFIWKPIDAWVTDADTVYVSTEGLISQVALAALPLPSATRMTPVRDRYLSGRHYLNRVFGMRQVAQGVRPLRLDNQSTITLIGGIDYESATNEPSQVAPRPTYWQKQIMDRKLAPFKGLLSTEPEVSAIGKLLPHHNLLRRKNATEEQCRQLLSRPPTLLHIATHGLYLRQQVGPDSAETLVYSDDALTRAALALSGVNRLWQHDISIMAAQDGLLTAYEIADIDLRRTRLAVLSACETGLGDSGLFASSEGLLGLQRGFRLAGVDKMIVSLWAVDDERTQQFMHAFYTALRAGNEVRSAFRQAQNTLLTTDDPAYWAAFVLLE